MCHDQSKLPNILAPLPPASADEVIEQLLRGGRFKLERIVSTGQATPPGEWYDQETDEWVLVLSGAARLRFADEPHDRPLRPGDYLHIAAHRRHRVEWTDPGQATVCLSLHYEEESSLTNCRYSTPDSTG